MKTSMKWWMGVVLAAAACTGNNPKLEPGATSFVTEEPGYAGDSRNTAGGDAEAAPNSPAAGSDNDKALLHGEVSIDFVRRKMRARHARR